MNWSQFRGMGRTSPTYNTPTIDTAVLVRILKQKRVPPPEKPDDDDDDFDRGPTNANAASR
jgi:hypothetical protein